MAQCVLVTGASGGIGQAIAATFAQSGNKVALAYHHNKTAAQNLCNSINGQGGAALAVQGNVANEQEVEAMFAQIEQELGPVQVLVNNAGVAQQKLFCSLSAQEWRQMLDAHVTGMFLCSRRALPGMIRQKQGCIVNIASMWGQVGASCEVHYSAAKAAIIGATKALAKEEGPSGVRVNCVAPGAIDTGMMAGFSQQDKQILCEEIPLGRLGTAQNVADAVAFLASPQAAYITGQVLAVNGGMVV